VSLRLGDISLASGRGITCLGCHEVSRLIRAGGNSDIETATYDWTKDHLKRASGQLSYLKTPDFCAGCHQQFVPGTGILGINTLGEWQSSPFASVAHAPVADAGAGGEAGAVLTSGASTAGTSCVDCHMPDDGSGTHDHSAPGGNVYIAQAFNEPDFATTVGKKLSSAIKLHAFAAGDGIHVLVLNVGAGHAFPTGVTDVREPWVEIQAVDVNQNVLARYGGPDSTGLIPASAGRMGMDIASADGTVLLSHELTNTTRIPFERVVPAQSQIEIVVQGPTTSVPGSSEIDAVLYYRNVRTTYFRAAMNDATGHAPDVEVARIRVGL
jgi:hypothetical protein